MRGFDQLPLVSLADLVASHAVFAPNKTAIVCGDLRISWRELDTRVTRVANGLISEGIARGDKVALVTANSPDMIDILLGINRAGAVMVPLSLLAPGDGLARMLEDSGARAVFVSSGYEHVLAPYVGALRQLEDRLFSVGFDAPGWRPFDAWRDKQSIERAAVPLSLGDECVIIYSSGTTGAPKGIVHTQYNRQQVALAIGLEFRFTGRCTALVTTPLYSNGTWLMLLPSLLVQAPLVIMTKFDPGTFLELVARERVTHTLMVPPQYAAVLSHPKLATTDLSSLRVLSSAGSTLRADLKRRLMDEMAPVLLELYGLTEGIGTVLRPEDVLRKTDSVGMPFFGAEIRIIDNDGRELPRGQVGEIIGYGSGSMKGYHNRPEATAEVIWTAADGRTFLKTGDIGKLDDEGFLYIVDRKKDMILSGGFNVYPRDIEEVIARHPEVADVTVIGIPDPRWDEVPLALVIPQPGVALDTDALKEWTNQRVGKHQRVTGVRLRESFPRNALGKVLKKELRAEYAG